LGRRGEVDELVPRLELVNNRLYLEIEDEVEPELVDEYNMHERIEHVHERGHAGILNTQRMMRLQYMTPRFHQRVYQIVQSCPIRWRRSKRHDSRQNAAHPIPTLSQPFFMLGCDAIGPLEQTPSGNFYLLVAVDYLIKWPATVEVPNINRRTTASFLLEEITCRRSVSQYLLTDRGSNFTSGYVRDFLTSIQYKYLITTAYQPQVNVLCDPLNQTLVQTLSKPFLRTGQHR
jgi:hypothetical protein